MKYRQDKSPPRIFLPMLAIVAALGGTYLLLLTLAPEVQKAIPLEQWQWSQPVKKPQLKENRLYIPKIKLNIEYKAGGTDVLNEYAWWRFPERGNPVKGGNFILSAHRFNLGFTPGQTLRKSPFYHLDYMQAGDNVYIDYEGKRYEYVIEKRFAIRPTQSEIEAPSDQPKLTIYTCLLRGQDAGREVLVARLSKIDIDPSLPIEGER